MTAQATGVGSLPGADIRAAVRLVVDVAADAGADLIHLPELPARGATASITGRGVGLLVDLAADLQPAGWRLTGGGVSAAGGGHDQRRARSLLAQDLDALEEHTQGWAGAVKVQVAGPWTLAATIERPFGDRLLADHGARRELSQSLAEGVGTHVRDVQRRVPGADVVVQVDEPGLPAVLAGAVPTASGFGRHRTVATPEASEALADVFGVITAAGARPAVHCCAAAVPVALFAEAGASAISLDVSQLTAAEVDALADVVHGGVDLWPGVEVAQEGGDRIDGLLRLLDSLDLDPQLAAPRTVVTPVCGLAGASPAAARAAYERAYRLARQLSEAEGKI